MPLLTPLLLAALAAATAPPRPPARVPAPLVDDGTILNFAPTLAFPQRALYAGALARFTGPPGSRIPVRSARNVRAVCFGERSHVAVLGSALRAAGVEATGGWSTLRGSRTRTWGRLSVSRAWLRGWGVSAWVFEGGNAGDGGSR
ncbi:hypothetical protein HO173_007563 [Letharia columbiana]|uniref:Rhodanese domain-containing protein n=1 Tax=Letharia columbiana TaxID=112416 RepID=A0A8H6FSY4_9LECA|nr:uncharacterized protein HO173_007563 [Letharia columbiana]KAF6234143.1 hypothetical protein HO173_007563 [Letharia columbiana]